jgi:hypothetical protein
MGLRELLPWRDFVIETAWTPEVAIAELQKQIDTPERWQVRGGPTFAGLLLNGNTFRLYRKIRNRNSWLPRIDVVIQPSHHNGARVRIKMRMNTSTMLFMIFWMIFSTVFGFAMIAKSLGAKEWNDALYGMFFPVFGGALMTLGFVPEANKAERLLREIFANAPAFPAPVETGVAYR